MPNPRRGAVRRRYVDAAKHMVTMGHAWLRQVTPGVEGTLPTIVVTGVQRGGTTSLFRYLCSHHQVVEPLSKELNYFSLYYGRGPQWYRGNFPALTRGQITVEASPLYLVDPRVPERAATDLPDAHFVAMLRNPTERAYSHYLHNLEHGIEPLSFADALDAEPERLERARRLGIESRRGFALMRNASYMHRGRYPEHLQRWYDNIPPERLHVIRSEDLFSDPETVLNPLFAQVGLGPDPTIVFRRTNHWDDDEHTQLTPELRHRLDESFAGPNELLASMLGWGSTWDRSTAR